MIVQCPNCDTTFNLADELYVAGRKVRCSQCKNVFALPEVEAELPPAEASDTSAPLKGKWQKRILLIAFLVVFAGIGYGGYALYSLFAGGDDSFDAYMAPVEGLPEIDKASLQNIELDNVNQIAVNNSKAGRLTIVYGDIINKSEKPKQMLSVRVFLLDKGNKILAWQQQIGGVVLSQFQLETLNEQEIKSALSNTIDIVVNNTDVQPGQRVPFQVIFFNAPIPQYFDVIPVVAKDADTPLQNMGGASAVPVSPSPSPVNSSPTPAT